MDIGGGNENEIENGIKIGGGNENKEGLRLSVSDGTATAATEKRGGRKRKDSREYSVSIVDGGLLPPCCTMLVRLDLVTDSPKEYFSMSS